MEKLLNRTLIFISLCILLALIAVPTAFAQEQAEGEGETGGFQQLEPIKGFIDVEGQENIDLASFLNGAFRLGVAVATALAVIMITIGGIKYMTSESISGKGEGKEYIIDSIWGLVLILGAVVLLNVINPEIIEFKIIERLQNLELEVPEGTTEEITGEEKEIRDRLAEAGIAVNNGPCPPGSNGEGCTNLAGLPENAIAGIISFKETCESTLNSTCPVTITGGAEPGHETHGPGKPIIDIKRNSVLIEYLLKNNTGIEETPIGTLYNLGNDDYVDEVVGTPHIHVCYDMSCPIKG